MTLNDLVGRHLLSGVDRGSGVKGEYDDHAPETFTFVLDGVAYTATEDPDDGYRSSMEDIVVGGEVKNMFAPCAVLARMRPHGEFDNNDVLELIDETTGKVVLSVGTANADDYYPWWVAEWSPENMAANADKDQP